MTKPESKLLQDCAHLLRAFRYSMDRDVPFPSLEKLNNLIREVEHCIQRPKEEIPLKMWIQNQAEILGITWSGAYNRFQKGQLKAPKLRRVNSRVVWVQV